MSAPLIEAWLHGRSLARGLPAPVADRGGYRIDTAGPTETARWVFAHGCAGLGALGREIVGADYALKLLGTGAELAAMLPRGWRIDEGGSDARHVALPTGYAWRRDRVGDVIRLRIVTEDGALAASGYGADTPDAFVYDRIVTEQGHRRHGLATALMAALRDERRHSASIGLLVATASGALVYRRIGWRTVSPYATAIRDRSC